VLMNFSELQAKESVAWVQARGSVEAVW
jgi:hypothetical protein